MRLKARQCLIITCTFLLLTVIRYIFHILQKPKDKKQTSVLPSDTVFEADLDKMFQSKDGLPDGVYAFPAVYFPDRSHTEGNCN